MKLADVIKSVLCPVYPKVKHRCKCDDPIPRRNGCAYGWCDIIVCDRCGKVITVWYGECKFPYSRYE